MTTQEHSLVLPVASLGYAFLSSLQSINRPLVGLSSAFHDTKEPHTGARARVLSFSTAVISIPDFSFLRFILILLVLRIPPFHIFAHNVGNLSDL